MTSHNVKSCPDCGREFFADRKWCRLCAPKYVPMWECERCGFMTYVELEMKDGELQCTRCISRGPDPTPDEIRAMAAELRAKREPGWAMD